MIYVNKKDNDTDVIIPWIASIAEILDITFCTLLLKQANKNEEPNISWIDRVIYSTYMKWGYFHYYEAVFRLQLSIIFVCIQSNDTNVTERGAAAAAAQVLAFFR